LLIDNKYILNNKIKTRLKAIRPTRKATILTEKQWFLLWKIPLTNNQKELFWRFCLNSYPTGERIKFFSNGSCPFCKKINYDRNHMLFECRISNRIITYFTKIIPNLILYEDDWLYITKRCFGKGKIKKDGLKASILILIFLEISSIFKQKTHDPDKFITSEISITRIKLKLKNFKQIVNKLNLDINM